jgi:hypothetical protein
MIVLAHIFGVPVEELLGPSASGMMAGMALGLASLMSMVRRKASRH